MNYTIIDDIISQRDGKNEHHLYSRGILDEEGFSNIVGSFSLAEAFAEVREIILIAKKTAESF